MKDLIKTIEELQVLARKHRRAALKELPTRTIFIDRMLASLGWDVHDPAEVELEYTTVDGRAVDYALKINAKPVIFLEAKALDDQLDDVKAVTQVVGYAANGGVNWCILTNGVRYKIYSSQELASAPDKLLFEISIDPDDVDGNPLAQVAASFNRLSRDSIAAGLLDDLGEEVFTTAKVRKALDRLITDQDDALLRVVRRALDGSNISPNQIRAALARIWSLSTPKPPKFEGVRTKGKHGTGVVRTVRGKDTGEPFHLDGKPAEVIDVYRGLDKMCHELAPGQISRRHLAKIIAWGIGKTVFCSTHLLQGGLRVWVTVEPHEIPPGTSFARDVSNVGRWGAGKVELAIDNTSTLLAAQSLVALAYQKAASKG